jgi:hypothetical protein
VPPPTSKRLELSAAHPIIKPCGCNFSEATTESNPLSIAGFWALNLGINRKTVARKLRHLGAEALRLNALHNQSLPLATDVQFDELETFEHTKCKPLSVALAVENHSRRILGIQVSEMPSKGRLAKISRKKYGPRKDERNQGLHRLFQQTMPLCGKSVSMLSDQCPRYMPMVQKVMKQNPDITVNYEQTKGGRGSSTGQGEIKKLFYDPLFSLNHTCAMLRAWINRLFRRTWNTTKKLERLVDHLNLYAYYHNTRLIKALEP